jgi:hypothetical protein
MLIWQLWHKVVVDNAWRGRISPHIDQTYTLCNTKKKETALHRFWSCEYSQRFWMFSTSLLNRLAKLTNSSSWDVHDWSQSLFVSSIPRCFAPIANLWSLLCGLMLWYSLIARNQQVFFQQRWSPHHTTSLIWRGLLEYAQAAWSKTLRRITKEPSNTQKALKRFDSN